MKDILFILLLFSSIHCYGQNKTMLIDQQSNSYRSYRYDNLIKIDSISQLSSVIQFNTNGYLERILGSLSDSIHFSHGQVVDLEEVFKKNSITFIGDAVKPKYILNYKLTDKTVGIKSFILTLDLDEYGQLLKINWPRKRYDDKSKFISRDEIKQFALEQAKLRRLDTSSYKIYFGYNSHLDKLCWQFMFPDTVLLKRYDGKIKKRYNVLVVDWNELRIVNEFQYDKISIS